MLGQRLYDLRRKQGLSQEQLAETAELILTFFAE